MTNTAPNHLISTETAAEIIGVTDGRVRQMLRDGSLGGFRVSPRAWVVYRSEAERVRDLDRKPGPRSKKSLSPS